MDFADISLDSYNSLKQALSIAVLRKSLNQDSSTVLTLINDMKSTNSKIMENSVTPHIGTNIDIRV